ncbi:hypothetical protein MP228_001788 [Amoeboaphelidium protococcarum]|nr:hypothetical protein MP228_001788 [Amoeboaphelidium protococcarum]
MTKSLLDEIAKAVEAQNNVGIIQISSKLIEQYSNVPNFYLLRAMVYLGECNYDAVVKDAQTLLKFEDCTSDEIMPKCVTLHSNAFDMCGRAYRGLQLSDKAEECFKKSVELNKAELQRRKVLKRQNDESARLDNVLKKRVNVRRIVLQSLQAAMVVIVLAFLLKQWDII